MRIRDCADSALLVELDDSAGGSARGKAVALARALRVAAPAGLGACIVGLRSLLVEYDCLATERSDLAGAIMSAARAASSAPPEAGRQWRLSVCFDETVAPDLGFVADRAGTDVAGVIALLCGSDLQVALIGHLPGLPYLTGLPPALDLRRRDTPRPTVPGGSVAVAAAMACVYPRSAPGGWHLVGRTPARLFDPRRDPPTPLLPGDSVRFEPLGLDALGSAADGLRRGLAG